MNAAKDAAGSGKDFGQAVKENNAAGNDSLGQQMQSLKEIIGAEPNPGNDNGGAYD